VLNLLGLLAWLYLIEIAGAIGADSTAQRLSIAE